MCLQRFAFWLEKMEPEIKVSQIANASSRGGSTVAQSVHPQQLCRMRQRDSLKSLLITPNCIIYVISVFLSFRVSSDQPLSFLFHFHLCYDTNTPKAKASKGEKIPWRCDDR